MTDLQKLSDSLYEKMDKELDARKAEMKKVSSEDIINGYIPYELVYKEDLLSCFEFDYINLKEEDYLFLLNLEKPLEWLYTQWLDSDDSHMEQLTAFIENALYIERRN